MTREKERRIGIHRMKMPCRHVYVMYIATLQIYVNLPPSGLIIKVTAVHSATNAGIPLHSNCENNSCFLPGQQCSTHAMQSSNAAVRLARWVSRWRGSSSLSAGDRSSSSSSGKQKEEGARDTDESMLSDDDDVDESDGIVGTSMLNYYLGAPASISLYAPSSTASSILDRHPAATLVTVLSTGWLAALFFVWPFPTTVHAMLALVVALLTWTALQWAALVKHAMAACLAAYHDRGASIAEYSSRPLLASPSTPPFSSSPFSRRRKEWSRSRRLAVFAASMLSIAIMLNAVPPREASTPLPPLIPADPNIPEKYLIAANLYNNEEVFGEWSTELVHLCRHREPAFLYMGEWQQSR